jgi:hypothetical protein
MAYPTGSGSEILARTTIHALTNSWTSFPWDGTTAVIGASHTVPALHIITVLSITFCEQNSLTDALISLLMNDGIGNKFILYKVPLGSRQTYVFSDKLVLIGGDKLDVYTEVAGNIDLVCNYIDQDWT